MDSLEENANTQTTPQPANSDEKTASPDTPKQQQAAPVKPEKPKQSYKCLVCSKSYSKKTSLFTHHKTHPEHCVHCGENRGSSVENIYEHNLKHMNIRPYVCKACGDSFLRNQQFVEHEKSHLEKKTEDKDAAATAATAAPASTVKEKENKYKCKTCQLSYTNWKLFYKHQQESGHFNEKFLCEICGSEFLSNFLLSQHIRRLHKRPDGESFPCSSCSKVFASKPNLDSHIKKIHQNDNKQHRCETCNNLFSSAPNLKQHIKTVHEVEREFECQTCKKPFKAKNRLTRHEKEVHMGKNGNSDEVRMFNCDHCQKKYKRSWHQARHNQMKHENSNASTATTASSSASTPPTPEINGNLANLPSANNLNNNSIVNNNNNSSSSSSNFNYQQSQIPPQQVHPSASIPIQQSQPSPAPSQMPSSHFNSHMQHSPQQSIIPPATQQQQQNVWNQQQQHTPPQHLAGSGGYEMMDTKSSYGASPTTNASAPPPMANGEYPQHHLHLQHLHHHYSINEQYPNKYEMQSPTAQAPPPTPSVQQVTYDPSWNQPSWSYNQQHVIYNSAYNGTPPQQVAYDPSWQQQQQMVPTWDYNQQQHHSMYNNAYNNYKTDYNCLNQPPPPTTTTQQQQQQPPVVAAAAAAVPAPQQTHLHHQQGTDPSSTIYNGANYNYYYQSPDSHQVVHPHQHLQTDYALNHHLHSNYPNQNNPM